MVLFKKILCPTDFSETSYQALRTAVKLAHTWPTEVCVLHVEPDLNQLIAVGAVHPQEAAYQRAEAVRNLSEVVEQHTPAHLHTNTLLRQGDAARETTKVAREQGVDLIVITAHGAGGGHAGIPGSVVEGILADAPCPVLVLNVPEPAVTETQGVHEEGPALRPDFEIAHSGRHALYLDGD